MIKYHNSKIIDSEKKEISIKRYLDFSKDKKILYNNFFLDDFKVVIKVPLLIKEISEQDIKVEHFDIVNDIYLISY
jgi:hypothetical protein